MRRETNPRGALGPGTELLLYQTEDGQTRLQVRLEEETVWLSQASMTELLTNQSAATCQA